MPAASGAEAEVPVCLSVHWWCRSVVTICGSVATPLLKVVVKVEAQASLYQGTRPCRVVLPTDSVWMLLV